MKGPYFLPHQAVPQWRIGGLLILASVEEKKDDGHRWYHVSFSREDRMPDYADMVLVRRCMFRPDAADVFMLFPPESEHYNLHNFCLHLWRRLSPDRLIPDLRVDDGPGFGRGV